MISGTRQDIFDLFNRHKYSDAAEAAHAYLEKNPTDEAVLHVLADSAMNSGLVDVGERAMAYLLAQKRTPHRLSSMAVVLSAKGQIDAALALLKEALALDPAHARSWSLISGLNSFTKSDPLITKAKRILRQSTTSPQSRRAVQFALSKAMNDLRKWDKAWDYAARASATATPEYDPDGMDRWVSDIQESFNSDFLARRKGRGVESRAPIFIVGMPRSGTTLMEIILAASGQVTAMGEMRTIADLCEAAVQDDAARGYPVHNHDWVHRWQNSAFTAAGEHVLQAVMRRNEGTLPERFSNKLPGNLLYLGQIGLMTPNAHIIWMQRDPLDTCVSCFLGQFAAGHQYTNRIDWLARAAQAFQKAGDLLAPIVPNPVLKVRYEDLVTRPEEEIRRVLDFLGLEWNAECLTPSPAGFTTTTRSVAQVRKPINAASVGAWRRYANRIGPLAEALQIGAATAA